MLTKSSSVLPHRLKEVPLFSNMPKANLDALAARTHVRNFSQGQIICHEGDQGHDLLVLEKGRLRVSRFTVTGKEVVLATLEPTTAVGELALLDGEPRSATITAQRLSSVRLMSRTVFLEMLHQEPGATEGLLRTLAMLVRSGNERHLDVLGLDALGRLTKWLLTRATAKGISGPEGLIVPMDRTQGELAAELGMTRVRLNQIIRQLEAQGLVRVEREQTILLEPESLMAFAF